MRGIHNSSKRLRDLSQNEGSHGSDKDRMRHVCRELAYVTNSGTDDCPGNTVSVIDTETDRVVDTIKVGSRPTGVAITPNGRRVYVANREDNSVSVIDTAAGKVVDTIDSVGNGPVTIVITPDATRAYVSNFRENTVSVIDLTSNVVTDVIPVRHFPLGQAVGNTPFGTRDYVANFYDDTVSVINANPNSKFYNKVIFTISVGDGPVDVALTPDRSTAYVTNEFSNTVSAIDTGTNKVTTIAVGRAPTGVGIGNTPYGIRAYVTNEESDEIYVIDAAPTSPTYNTVVDVIVKNVGDSPSDVAFTANGLKAYVPNNFDNNVSVIDTFTNKVIRTIDVGVFPNLIAIGRVCRINSEHHEN
ncbi:beta-propeller fold lactonase family protein [Falsibacillus pallidus]|uniref:YVTN family beta-propeller protein n=1 Tax=Falsibacillus pallidus TaxID=493781 RepID=A0A370G530_9BACI|nr:beta-propeller fold lactonase family protein [Falsibacillus pallidus]RDI37929.1 YVTN family beta-propeller protein [Falsibacillus pallidus]